MSVIDVQCHYCLDKTETTVTLHVPPAVLYVLIVVDVVGSVWPMFSA